MNFNCLGPRQLKFMKGLLYSFIAKALGHGIFEYFFIEGVCVSEGRMGRLLVPRAQYKWVRLHGERLCC